MTITFEDQINGRAATISNREAIEQELATVRETDRSAFICIGCHTVQNGIGAQYGTLGWVCDDNCWGAAVRQNLA